MTTTYDLPEFPAPGITLDGTTVIASCNFDDDRVSVLLLNPQPPYYTVQVLAAERTEWVAEQTEDFPNIVPATIEYADLMGIVLTEH